MERLYKGSSIPMFNLHKMSNHDDDHLKYYKPH